jgi:DNA-binding HxlR family transcriptional regulator
MHMTHTTPPTMEEARRATTDVTPPEPSTTPLSSLLISAELTENLERLRRDARRFGQSLKDTIVAQRPAATDALLQSASASTQRLFSKWNLEILYTLAFTPNARFSELKRRLGPISSRTLSNKLKELETEGYLERRVTTTRPLRVDYALTEQGRNIAALSAPLVAHLNERYTAHENEAVHAESTA